MPPQSIRIHGRDAVAAFFATVPADGRLDLIRLAVTRANRHPALAAYLPDATTGECRGYGIMVLTIDGDHVSSITGFPDANLFVVFDLPDTPLSRPGEGSPGAARPLPPARPAGPNGRLPAGVRPG
jgi:RNA polymerase sigma-70 factor (ECF subfamily)